MAVLCHGAPAPVGEAGREGGTTAVRHKNREVRRTVVPDWLAGLHGLVPPWLAEVVRPKPAPLTWPDMIRAALAICVPLSAALAVGQGTLGVLPAVGGLSWRGSRWRVLTPFLTP
jgi:hypothetical protein